MSERVRSAIIFVALILLLFAGGRFYPVFFTLFWLLFSWGAAGELGKLLGLKTARSRLPLLLYPLGLLIPALFPALSAPASALLFFAWLAVLLAAQFMSLAILQGPEKLKEPIKLGLGGLYLAFPAFAAESILRDVPRGWFFLLLAFVSPWISDTAAWFFGRRFGRRKAFPRLSPGKTWAGVLAALLLSLTVYTLFALTPLRAVFAEAGFPLWTLPLLGLLFSLAAQLGDLLESALKRRAGVKDSGNLIPGHGGLIDRFDSTLFLLPTLYFVLILRSLF